MLGEDESRRACGKRKALGSVPCVALPLPMLLRTDGMVWTPPWKVSVSRKTLTDTKGDRAMQVTRIGLDIAKNVFQVHGVNAQGKVVVQKQLSRSKVLTYFAQLPACRIGREACGSAH